MQADPRVLALAQALMQRRLAPKFPRTPWDAPQAPRYPWDERPIVTPKTPQGRTF